MYQYFGGDWPPRRADVWIRSPAVIPSRRKEMAAAAEEALTSPRKRSSLSEHFASIGQQRVSGASPRTRASSFSQHFANISQRQEGDDTSSQQASRSGATEKPGEYGIHASPKKRSSFSQHFASKRPVAVTPQHADREAEQESIRTGGNGGGGEATGGNLVSDDGRTNYLSEDIPLKAEQTADQAREVMATESSAAAARVGAHDTLVSGPWWRAPLGCVVQGLQRVACLSIEK